MFTFKNLKPGFRMELIDELLDVCKEVKGCKFEIERRRELRDKKVKLMNYIDESNLFSQLNGFSETFHILEPCGLATRNAIYFGLAAYYPNMGIVAVYSSLFPGYLKNIFPDEEERNRFVETFEVLFHESNEKYQPDIREILGREEWKKIQQSSISHEGIRSILTTRITAYMNSQLEAGDGRPKRPKP